MEKLAVFLAAIFLVVIGARGTYKAIWNSFFPNEPIVTTPVSTLPGQSALTTVPGTNVPKGASRSQNQSPNGYATNPNEVGQQAAKATQQWISGVLSGTSSGASNGYIAPGTNGNASNVTSVNVPPGKQAVISTGVPSWWPSWLPYPSWFPHSGAGYTGQQRSIP